MEESRPPSRWFETGLDNTEVPPGTSANPPPRSSTTERSTRVSSHLVQGKKNRWIRTKIFKLKNQTLSAWRPVMSEKGAFLLFLIFSFVCIPMGAIFIKLSKTMNEITLDYTDCFADDGSNCKDFVLDVDNQIAGDHCECSLTFSLHEHMDDQVMMYYGLSNFYQNHRRYVESKDDNQLLGDDITAEPSDQCDPLSKAFDANVNQVLPIVPCGAIANSLFNDSFQLECVVDGSPNVVVPLIRTGIAWESDKKYRFKNPSGSGSLESRFAGTTKPVNWHKYVWELDPEDESNNGLENEDLIVWMKTAAFPQFRKPYRKIDHSDENFKNGLPTGQYLLRVNYSYPVTQFDGTKSVILTRSTLIGTFDIFLGVMYVVAGSLAFCISILILVLHIKYSLSKRIMQSNPDPADLRASTAQLVDKLKPNFLSKQKSQFPQTS